MFNNRIAFKAELKLRTKPLPVVTDQSSQNVADNLHSAVMLNHRLHFYTSFPTAYTVIKAIYFSSLKLQTKCKHTFGINQILPFKLTNQNKLS